MCVIFSTIIGRYCEIGRTDITTEPPPSCAPQPNTHPSRTTITPNEYPARGIRQRFTMSHPVPDARAISEYIFIYQKNVPITELCMSKNTDLPLLRYLPKKGVRIFPRAPTQGLVVIPKPNIHPSRRLKTMISVSEDPARLPRQRFTVSLCAGCGADHGQGPRPHPRVHHQVLPGPLPGNGINRPPALRKATGSLLLNGCKTDFVLRHNTRQVRLILSIPTF